MKKVLIALDYTSTTQKVAETGYLIAKSMGAEVILLHIILDLVFYSPSYLNMGPLQLDSSETIIDSAQNFLNRTKKHLGNTSIQTIVKEGEFAETILECAKENKVDIIVMGSHSRRWLEEVLMGSVTADVLKKSKIPMFIVPTKKQN